MPLHRPLVGNLANSLIRHLGENCVKRGDRCEETKQHHAVKSGLFILVCRWWEEGRREGRKKKEKEETYRGRVVEEDRAGGQGESEDNCADGQPLRLVLGLER